MENPDAPPIDLNKVLEDFESTLIIILDRLLKKLNTSKPPETIFHYTNDLGLHGIFESGQLRLSNIFSLNDPSELSHGLSHAITILNSETMNGPPEAKKFAENFSRFCQDGIKHSAYYFVSSFSTNEHDLGQWRSYADNGRGYALEFDANLLASDFAAKESGSSGQRNSTFPVTYADNEIIDIHRQFITAFIPLISVPLNMTCTGLSAQDYQTHLSSILSMYALEASLYFKHEAYEKEAEFRFLQIFGRDEPMDVKWRARSNELVAYREFDWRGTQPRVLKRIIIGPAADRQKATRFIKECLTAYHPKNQVDVEIDYSTIPYRAVPN
jgi:hypothetical protein